MLAPLVLAVALGQCVEPVSPNSPPPCAAANVPGCLPGYRADRDEHGRRIYVCDRTLEQHEDRRADIAPAPPPRPAPPPAWEHSAARQRSRGHLALLVVPGATSGLTGDDRDRAEPLGGFGLELRGPVGGARVRGLVQFASFGRVAEVALKYDFNDGGQIRPFLSIGVGGASVNPNPEWRLSGSLSGGLDLYLTRNVFFLAEVQGRRFTRRSDDGPAFGLEDTGLKQTALMFGLGFYL